MSILEIQFCEIFEAKVKELQILSLLSETLTPKGQSRMKELKDFVVANFQNFLSITGK